HAAMVQVHEPAVADHSDVLAGEPSTGSIRRGGEADQTVRADPARHHWCRLGVWFDDRDRFGFDTLGSELKTAPRHRHAETLMRTLEVVDVHPRVELCLGVVDRHEDFAV